jgi:gliding motility-associated-like protein
MLLGKFDATGNILWMREYNFTHNSLTGFDNVASAIELPNGDLAFCANAPGINTDVGQPLPATYNIIGVLSNTGTIKWVKRFREYYIESGGPVVGISAINNTLFVAASYGVIKLSIADGTLMNLQKKYQNLGELISIESTGSMLIAYSDSHQLLIDENLNLIAAYRMVTPGISYYWNNAGFSSETGSTIQGSNNSTNNDNAVQLTRFMEAGKLNWSYRYPYPANEERQLWGSRNTLDGGTVAIGSLSKKINDNNNEPADIFVLRTDSQGRIPDCRRASTNITLESEQGQFVELVARNYPLITQTITPTLPLQDANLGVQSLCNTDKCNLLDIHSKDTVCSFTDTVSIFATRDSACDGFTEWITDSSEVRILSSTDSLLKIQVKRLGTIRIYARINAGCRLLSDSLNITVLKSPDSVNLGPDIQLCKISTYTFNAGSGFKTYVWQDGSTDSTLTIFNPGTYHVTVTDYCGNSYRDTVIVSQAPDIPFDLGADRELCSNDTLTITAPPGFVKYYWSPNYRINNLYTQSIRVSPQKDTTYIVIAEKAPGCLVTDSIRIKVNKADSLFIGNDTSFCQNDTITLTANPGFVSYQWNTGNTNPSIGVFNKGRYWVKATNSKGCVSYDTLEIVNLYNLPVINLGNDFSLCRDKIHVFDAGNHLAYQWQDGSSSRTFSTSSPGTYWATVTNSNGCIASDTVKIISLLENPKGFLDSTADICTGQRLELQAAPGYREYLWYNNSRSSVITITSPGSYWLQVTNGDGCISRDTILVKAKDCIKGVFFPNAFTPANGGGNNYFRPIVYGQLESFHLIVFNRWGQKVFESRDPFKGWDGRINGQLQDTQSFTWTATYQFSGTNEKKEIDKGTVVLIR